MPDLSDAAKRALVYWPQIEFAARYRLTTADLWSTIRDAAEQAGWASPGVTLRGVNQLRAIATQIQNAGRNFARADEDQRLDYTMTAGAPWSRSDAERGALPMWQARFEHTFMQDGEEVTEWRTSVFAGRLPATVADMRAAIAEDAEQLADKYGVDHVGISGVHVLAV